MRGLYFANVQNVKKEYIFNKKVMTKEDNEINVRLELASNGAIFTDLDCEDKYLGTMVFFNEREEDVAIYKELGGWLYTELEHRGLTGMNIELSIKVKEV